MTTAELLPARPRILGPEERLYPDDPPPVVSAVGNYTLAQRFTVDVAGRIVAIRWYHWGCSAPNVHPLSLWRDDGNRLVSLADTPPSGHVGWREVPLVTPLEVAAGDVLRVAYAVAGQAFGYTTGPTPDQAPSLAMDTAQGYYVTAVDSFPAVAAPGSHYFADVVYRSGSGEPEPEPPPTHAGRPWRAVLDAIAAAPELVELGPTLASRWIANMATPAILVVPVRRIALRGSSVRWELALQVVVPLQADSDDQLHDLLDVALAAIPAGRILGDTIYGQDDRAGASYVVSTTTLTV